jgi:hypothetical protein
MISMRGGGFEKGDIVVLLFVSSLWLYGIPLAPDVGARLEDRGENLLKGDILEVLIEVYFVRESRCESLTT